MARNACILAALLITLGAGCDVVEFHAPQFSVSGPRGPVLVGTEAPFYLGTGCTDGGRWQVDVCAADSLSNTTIWFQPEGVFELVDQRANGGTVRALREGRAELHARSLLDGREVYGSDVLEAAVADEIEVTGCAIRTLAERDGLQVSLRSSRLDKYLSVPDEPLIELVGDPPATLEMTSKGSSGPDQPMQQFYMSFQDENFIGEIELWSPWLQRTAHTIRILDPAEVDGLPLALRRYVNYVGVQGEPTWQGNRVCDRVEILGETLTPEVCSWDADPTVDASVKGPFDSVGFDVRLYEHSEGECRVRMTLVASGAFEEIAFQAPYVP